MEGNGREHLPFIFACIFVSAILVCIRHWRNPPFPQEGGIVQFASPTLFLPIVAYAPFSPRPQHFPGYLIFSLMLAAPSNSKG